MFVKTHKAGSTTTSCILQRFGYEHNLTFVLPMIGRSDVGWPFILKQEDIIPSADGKFNVLIDHTVYHRELIEHIMPQNTVYISILRHPLGQLRSVFNWYHYDKSLYFKGFDLTDPVASFLKDPMKFQIPYITKNIAPMTKTKNFMAFDLGFPIGLFDHQSSVDKFVEKISKEFDLILILEYFNESLILLRRLMCWTLKDILYSVVPKNLRYYPKPTTSDATLVRLHRKWSNVDYQLYDYFNSTLWQKIKKQDDGFYQEVRHFENVLHSTTSYCASAIILGYGGYVNRDTNKTVRSWVVNDTAGILTIPKTSWNDEFDIDPSLCIKLKMGWIDWEYVLKNKHRLPTNVSETVKSSIRIPKPLGAWEKVLANFNIK
ncbi:galactosylceramide sulfotransferase-like isoform X2 [Branchiostoma floridae x Branchiostoma belcheri]